MSFKFLRSLSVSPRYLWVSITSLVFVGFLMPVTSTASDTKKENQTAGNPSNTAGQLANTPNIALPRPDLGCEFVKKGEWLNLIVRNGAPTDHLPAKRFNVSYDYTFAIHPDFGSAYNINGLESGETHEKQVLKLPLQAGMLLHGRIDTKKEIAELNERNNICTFSTRKIAKPATVGFGSKVVQIKEQNSKSGALLSSTNNSHIGTRPGVGKTAIPSGKNTTQPDMNTSRVGLVKALNKTDGEQKSSLIRNRIEIVTSAPDSVFLGQKNIPVTVRVRNLSLQTVDGARIKLNIKLTNGTLTTSSIPFGLLGGATITKTLKFSALQTMFHGQGLIQGEAQLVKSNIAGKIYGKPLATKPIPNITLLKVIADKPNTLSKKGQPKARKSKAIKAGNSQPTNTNSVVVKQNGSKPTPKKTTNTSNTTTGTGMKMIVQ